MKTQTLTLIAALALAGCSSKFEDQDDNPGGSNNTGTDTDNDDVDSDPDADGDGVAASEDCNDDDATIYPGAGDQCDGIDNDCDDIIDEGWDKATFYEDEDGDEYGNRNRDIEGSTDCPPEGYVLDNTDCNDDDAEVYPGAEEIIGDEKDNDCDGDEDERFDISEISEQDDEDANLGSRSSIAVDSANNTHIVFHDSIGGAVLYQRIDADGSMLEENVVVAAENIDGEHLDAEVDGDGTLHIGYTSSMGTFAATLTELKYIKRSAGGVWSEASTIVGGETGEVDHGQYVDLAIQYGALTGYTPTFAYLNADDGTPMIADVLATDLYPIFPAGTSYLDTLTGVGSGLFTAIDIDNAGTTHVAFYDPNAVDTGEIGIDWGGLDLTTPQIQYTKWTWNPDDVITSLDIGDLVPSYGTFEETVSESQYDTVSLKTRNEDQIACLATQDTENRDLIFGCREGGSWVMETVYSEGVTGAQPALAINDADEYFISFYDEGTKDLKLAMKRKEMDWEVITVDSEGWVGKASSIAIGPDNKIHISYYDETNGTLRHAVGY